MKQMIDVLRAKPYSKKELMSILEEHFPETSQEALRKRCERSLKKLRSLGLVEERNGKYCWYIYVNHFKNREDYDAKLLHSQKLVPALRRIAGIYVSRYSVRELDEFETQEDALIYDECAEDHLRAYPEVWAFFDGLRGVREKAEQEKEKFNVRLMNKLESRFKKKAVKSSRGVRLKAFIMDNVSSVIYSQILSNRPMSIEIGKDGKIWLGNTLIGAGKRTCSTLKRFLKEEITDESNVAEVHHIWRTEMEAFAAQPRLQKEVRKLIIRIESGEPLLGKCDTCPEAYMRANAGSIDRFSKS